MTRAALGILVLTAFFGSGGVILPEARAQDPFAPLFERASRWRCSAESSFVCDGKGCREAEVEITVHLNLEKREYSRCDRRGCEPRPFTVYPAGLHTVVSVEPHFFLKAANDGGSFVEISTLGTATRLNFGACEPETTDAANKPIIK